MSIKLSRYEREEDALYLDTVEQYWGGDDSMRVIQVVMNHFKFGHGGFNGYFKDRKELFEEIERLLKEPRL